MKPSGDQAWGGWRLLRVRERNILNIPPSPPLPLCPPTIFYWRLTLMLISIKNMHFWWISAFASTHISVFAFEIAIKLLKNMKISKLISFPTLLSSHDKCGQNISHRKVDYIYIEWKRYINSPLRRFRYVWTLRDTKNWDETELKEKISKIDTINALVIVTTMLTDNVDYQYWLKLLTDNVEKLSMTTNFDWQSWLPILTTSLTTTVITDTDYQCWLPIALIMQSEAISRNGWQNLS